MYPFLQANAHLLNTNILNRCWAVDTSVGNITFPLALER